MTLFGLSEGTLRLSIFIGIFIIMTIAETLLPRRERRFSRSKRWFTNIGIMVTAFAAVSVVTFVVPVTALLAAVWAQTSGFGLFNLVQAPTWLVWLVCLAALDFVIWGQHVVTHKIPLLWRIHRVHHSDEDLDASSAVRFHPAEIVISIFIKAVAVIALGAPPVVVVVFEALVNASAMFNHANFRLPLWLDKVLRTVLVTPDMHRVHHSVINRETDSNYGFGLSIWDRIFSTYTDQPEKGHDGMTIGLSEWQDDAPTRLGWSLALPFWNPPKSKAQPSGSGKKPKASDDDQ